MEHSPRLRNRQRPRYGFYVDHMIDTVGGLFLMGGLAISGIVDWRDCSRNVHRIPDAFRGSLSGCVHAWKNFGSRSQSSGPLKFAFCWPSEIQRCGFHRDVQIFGSPYRVFDVGGIVAIAGMAFMLVILTIRNTIKLYRAETLR